MRILWKTPKAAFFFSTQRWCGSTWNMGTRRAIMQRKTFTGAGYLPQLNFEEVVVLKLFWNDFFWLSYCSVIAGIHNYYTILSFFNFCDIVKIVVCQIWLFYYFTVFAITVIPRQFIAISLFFRTCLNPQIIFQFQKYT